MTDIEVFLPRERWTLLLHLAVTCYHSDLILGELEDLGASWDFLSRVDRLMECGSLDYGIAFSSAERRRTVLVVALTSSRAEFMDSLQHELFHFVRQYSAAEGITDEETMAYLMGDVNRALFPLVGDFLCGYGCPSVTR